METLEVSPEQSSTLTGSYVWEAPGKKFVIHLDLDVVDRVLQEVMRGFGALPRRGVEVGGLLLGSAEVGETTVVRIEDFWPITCEHKYGPSFQLSEADMARYEEGLRKHRYTAEKQRYTVGCYRSNTREGLLLSDDDIAHFNTFFPEPWNVFLLVKPYATRVSMAGFFFREENGSISKQSYLEFPFRRRELGGGVAASGVRPAQEPSPADETPLPPGGRHEEESLRRQPASLQESFAQPEPGRQQERQEEIGPIEEIEVELAVPENGREREAFRSPDAPESSPGDEMSSSLDRFRRTNIWIPLSFIFLLLGVLVGFQVALSYRPAKAAGVLGDPFALSLSASRAGENLHVRWDRTSIAVRNAQRGVLTIADGDYNTTVDLDVAQLHHPNVFYRNMTGEVRFRLEVFTSDRLSVAETLVWRK